MFQTLPMQPCDVDSTEDSSATSKRFVGMTLSSSLSYLLLSTYGGTLVYTSIYEYTYRCIDVCRCVNLGRGNATIYFPQSVVLRLHG